MSRENDYRKLLLVLIGIGILLNSAQTIIPAVEAESKSIEAIIELEPYSNDRITISVQFVDVINQPISHVNYDITVQHNFETVLEETGVHSHSGMGSHVTSPLDIRHNANDVIDVAITFRGIGLQEPYGGPIGKVFRAIEYPNLSQENLDSADFTPPLLIMPNDITIQAKDPSGIVVDFSVKAIDDVDGVIDFRCDPTTGSAFPIGETIVSCYASDNALNTQTKWFKVTVTEPPMPVVFIPDWVRNIAGFWCSGDIDDSGFIDAIQYLINNQVIIIPETELGYYNSGEIPSWIKSNACWWSNGQISDEDFTEGLQYLIRQGIIQLIGFRD